jgi:plasmid replication initiation protein
LLGISDKDFYGKVKLWSRKLIGNVLIFRGEDDEELQVAWLSSAIYRPKSGFVELEFSPKLKPFLLHLKSHFTAYELGNIVTLKHIYSIRMYELLKQYEKIGRRKFSVENLRELLMLENDEYSQFSDFRKRVLKPAQDELTEKTDIAFTWDEEREKQKCTAIDFFIKPQQRPLSKSKIGVSVKELETNEKIKNTHSVEQLLQLGVTKITAEILFQEYGEKRIQDGIAYTCAQHKDGKLNNPAGFVVEAIKNGYRDNQAEDRQHKEEAARAQADKQARRKEWERTKTHWNAWKSEQVQAYIAAMDAETLEREKAVFRESLKGSVMAKAVYASLESEALYFRMHMSGRVPGLKLAEWAQAVGVDISPFVEFARLEGKL